MSDFTRRFAGLEQAFPPASREKHEPDRLDTVVQLVHEIAGPGCRLNEARGISIASAAAATFLDLVPEVPPNEVWWVHTAGVSQPDAAQRLEFHLVNVVTGGIGIIRSTLETATPAWPAVFQFPLGRSILIPPGWTIRAVRGTGGAGFMSLFAVVVVYSLSEIPPGL